MKQPKILFFIEGFAPNEEELKLAASLGEGVQVAYRNSQFIDAQHRAEDCDGVIAVIDVPQPYENHPNAEDALAVWKQAVEERRALVGDKPAPAGEKTQDAAQAEGAARKTTAPASGVWKPNA